MTEIKDGDELSIDLPEGTGSCFVFPPALAGGQRVLGDAGCASLDPAAVVLPGGRVVAAGAVALEGASAPALFGLTFVPDPKSAEPGPEAARDFGGRVAAAFASRGEADGGSTPVLDILAVGSSPTRGAATSELLTLGSLKVARATLVLDQREHGHDTLLHLLAYGAWSREGLYVLTVGGEVQHAPAIDALADAAARTLAVREPAPPAPDDVARIGARLGQVGLGVLVLLAVSLAVLAARTRRLRG